MFWLLWVMLLPTFLCVCVIGFKKFFSRISRIFLHVEKVWSPIWCQCIKKTCFSHRSMLICFSWVKSVHCKDPALEVTQGHIQMHFTYWRPAHNQGKENLTPSHDQKSVKEFAGIFQSHHKCFGEKWLQVEGPQQGLISELSKGHEPPGSHAKWPEVELM